MLENLTVLAYELYIENDSEYQDRMNFEFDKELEEE